MNKKYLLRIEASASSVKTVSTSRRLCRFVPLGSVANIMKGSFSNTLTAANGSVNFGEFAAIRALSGQSVIFKVVSNWERLDKDGKPTGKAYNVLQPCNAAGQPLIEGFALSKWDLNPQPRICRDENGKLAQFNVTTNRLYSVAAAQLKPNITEVEWLNAIVAALGACVVEPVEYTAVKKDGVGIYTRVLFGVK